MWVTVKTNQPSHGQLFLEMLTWKTCTVYSEISHNSGIQSSSSSESPDYGIYIWIFMVQSFLDLNMGIVWWMQSTYKLT